MASLKRYGNVRRIGGEVRIQTCSGPRPLSLANRGRTVSLSADWDHVLTRQASPFGSTEKVSDTKLKNKPRVSFCTGSSYVGQWNPVAMSGLGEYTLPHGVQYEGGFKDGMFHGEGTLKYPSEARIDGIWENGRFTKYTYRFGDGLCYSTDDWEYCSPKDRRFFTCIEDGMKAAGRSLKTNRQPHRRIPKGWYDTEDGFYNPKKKCIVDSIDHKTIIRHVNRTEEKWILRHCRSSTCGNVGYRPDLYPDWDIGWEDNISDRETTFSEGSDFDTTSVHTYKLADD